MADGEAIVPRLFYIYAVSWSVEPLGKSIIPWPSCFYPPDVVLVSDFLPSLMLKYVFLLPHLYFAAQPLTKQCNNYVHIIFLCVCDLPVVSLNREKMKRARSNTLVAEVVLFLGALHIFAFPSNPVTPQPEKKE